MSLQNSSYNYSTYYDFISKGYNELYKVEQLAKLKIIKENITLNKHCKVLDVGCGTGISSEFDCFTVGIDPSIKMLSHGDGLRINSACEALPFKDKSFDLVVSITSVHNFKDIKSGLREIKRVGNDNFVISVLKKSAKHDEVVSLLKDNFKINKTIVENKDTIFFLE